LKHVLRFLQYFMKLLSLLHYMHNHKMNNNLFAHCVLINHRLQ
jgi:hypothetical protein